MGILLFGSIAETSITTTKDFADFNIKICEGDVELSIIYVAAIVTELDFRNGRNWIGKPSFRMSLACW